mgnify:CR=1 FL=1
MGDHVSRLRRAGGFGLVQAQVVERDGLPEVGDVLTVQRGADTKIWPAVEGVVIESAIAADREAGCQRFRPVVRYRYEVDGQRYEGSRIKWAMDQGFRKYTRARRLLDRYRAGAAIKVHYDPSRPGTAVLMTGGSNAAVMRPIYVIASTVAVYTLFTIGIAIAG